jgi:Leucine-rich repeat (LRR) protein
MGELAGPPQERLEELDLSGNRILRLPGQSLSGLRSLALLNVSLNRLSLLDTFPKVKLAKGAREKTEPVFVDRLWSPGIDSQHGGPVQQPYFSYRPARLHKLAESIPRS